MIVCLDGTTKSFWAFQEIKPDVVTDVCGIPILPIPGKLSSVVLVHPDDLVVHHGRKLNSEPYVSYGYCIASEFVAIFDANYIPESTWTLLQQHLPKPPSILVIECIRLQPAPAHYGFAQAIAAAARLQAKKTYFVQISHGMSHMQLSKCCEAVQAGREPHHFRHIDEEMSASRFSGDNAWMHVQSKPYAKHPLLRYSSLPKVLGLNEHDDEVVVEVALQEVQEVCFPYSRSPLLTFTAVDR